MRTNIGIQNVTSIKVSKVRSHKNRKDGGEDFFTRDFVFTDNEGNKVELTAFADCEAELKSK